MKTITRIITASALVIVAGGVLAFWIRTQTTTTPEPAARLTIAASLFPIADIARHVAGDEVKVLQILPANVSEHHYTPTSQQLFDLQQAKMLFVIGQGLDTWASDPIGRVAALPIVTVDTGIKLQEFDQAQSPDHAEETEEHGHEEGSIDPHYWLTVPNAQKIAATIAEQLGAIDPEYADEYQKNLLAYTEQLDTLEDELQHLAAQASPKEFIAMHDAWSYLADHYGLRLVATYEPVEGREPSIADLNRLREIVERYNIRVFFSEPQKQSIGAIRLLQNDFGLAIRVLDPIGGYAPYDSYVNLMRANMGALTR